MAVDAWVVGVSGVLVVGAIVGSWLVSRVAARKQEARLRRRTDEIQQKYTATIDQLRADQSRAQTELEQARGAFKRQLAVAAEQPLAAVKRAEERLREAYDELDRLRRGKDDRDSMSADLTDGFAATRPMHNGL
jgi:hypothetical protein